MNIRPVVAELFHADGRTDMTNLIIAAFCNFVKAPKKNVSSNLLRGVWNVLGSNLSARRVDFETEIDPDFYSVLQ
jgi:hypothetical protein